jgi:membrane protease subunit (stomatin/prohibitin family)
MASSIEFSRNYSDDSTDSGFQFEFFCNRCGSGYRTRFQPSVTGTINNALDAASSLFGGVFGAASNLSGRVKSATWEKAHDDAFVAATEELKDDFIQCPNCNNWVCRKKCWNEKRGLCKDCAPDLAVVMSVNQSIKAVDTIRESAVMSAEDKKVVEGDWSQTIQASCPSCHAPLATQAKFCPNCGAKIGAAGFCTSCGAKLQPGAKFCAECGNKAG